MLKKILSSELGKGTLILFIAINLYNFLNFLFHFIMGRLLGPEDYGILAVLMSIVYIYGIPAEAIQNLIVRYTSKFNVKRKYGEIKFLMIKSIKRSIKISLYFFVIVTIMSIFLARFLRINFWLLELTNILIFLCISGPVFKGILQGRKKFALFGFSMIIESIFKLSFAIMFVLLGFKVFGAIIGLLIGVVFGIVFSFYFNKEILQERKKTVKFDGIYSESIPYFIAMIAIFIALSLDIILAKRFFSPELAGKYSVLSMIGKMIFFGTISIGKAMFPISTENHETNKDSSKIFRKSLFIILCLCIIASLAFLIFPKLIIEILYGNQYIEMAPFLVYSGLSLSFLSLANLIIIYGLSIKRIRKPYLMFIFLIIEIILLFSFHNNIREYVISFMLSNIIMFIGSIFLVRR